MNPLRTIPAAALLLSLAGVADAQSDQGPGASGGVQSTLGEFALDAFEDVGTLYQEVVRHYWLTTSDIRMTMKASDAGTGYSDDVGNVAEKRIGPWDMFIVREAPSDYSLYAEFDWDNHAMSMRAKDSGGKDSLEFLPLGAEIETNGEATDVTMYFDADGNVYVPIGNGGYVQADFADAIAQAFDSLEFGVQAAIDSGAAEMVDALGSFAGSINDDDDYLEGLLPEEVLDVLGEYNEQTQWNRETQSWEVDPDAQGLLEQRLRALLRELAQARYGALTQFPLVNFALYSPTLVRAHGNVREESVTWGGQVGATRFTVASGSDAGYVIIFDGAGRLVLLRDTDGNTAEYMYDRDISVP